MSNIYHVAHFNYISDKVLEHSNIYLYFDNTTFHCTFQIGKSVHWRRRIVQIVGTVVKSMVILYRKLY